MENLSKIPRASGNREQVSERGRRKDMENFQDIGRGRKLEWE